MNLNPEQQQAVGHFLGPCIVTAVPGSGKTMTLTARVVNLLTKHHVHPSQILCLTFTNKAANEMRERVAQKAGVLADGVWISTFHALCLAVLRKYGSHVNLEPGFTVYSEKDQKELLTKIARMQEVELSPYQISELARAVNDLREDIEDFASATRSFPAASKDIMKEYLQSLDDFNAVDFSGILFKVWQLFKKKPVAAKRLHDKFKFVMIDEMQDTNTIQYEVVRAIADPDRTRKGNFFAVGDFNQSIFSWRGARPENIQKVAEDFDDVVEIVLPRNYRSTEQILEVAQRLIRHNDNARDVELISTRGSGAEVTMKVTAFPEEESERVAREIQRLCDQHGYQYSDFAILYRTNSLSKVPETFLRRHGIPYKIIGGFSFYDRKEIKIALAYLSFLSNPHDTISFAKLIQSPRRGVGPTAVGRLERLCHKDKISMLEACKRADEIKGISATARAEISKFVQTIEKWKSENDGGCALSKVVSGLFNDTGYTVFVENEMAKDEREGEQRAANLEEFMVGVVDFEQQKPKAKVVDFLHSVQLLTTDEKEVDEEQVSLLTMHSAKGLEFPVVFVIGCEDKMIPHPLAVKERGEDEERRLFYVAMTRAKDHLYLHRCKTRRGFSRSTQRYEFLPQFPSRFLTEILE
jgi:DNA helicase-2/ATP-dependent DNA helicase PcrA